jgi:TIR domain
MSTLEIFFSYAHTDEKLRKKLEEHLSILKWEGNIVEWHDRKIGAGQEWAREIDTHLTKAQIILLLVSAAFLHSDYCTGIEMKQAIERHEHGEAKVIPIILSPVLWQSSPLGKLQALPKDGKPVRSHYWYNQDEAFTDVAAGILKVVNELKNKSTSGEKPQAAQFSQALQGDLSRIPSGGVREVLYKLADDYRKIREALPSGRERTKLMSSLAERMRILVTRDEFSFDEINSFLQSKRLEEEGRRLLGLSIMRKYGDANYFEQVLQIIDDPHSAFEQWQALRALEEIVPSLTMAQKVTLRKILNKQRNYDVTKHQWIHPNSDRGRLSSRLLTATNI